MSDAFVHAYDPMWLVMFADERAALEDLLRPWLVSSVEHIGSTSVPGLAAKPVIDMLAGVASLDEARDAIGPLVRRGYVYTEHRPCALYFYKLGRGSPGGHTHHLHLTEPGSDLWRERLAFRDTLRSDPALLAEYQQLKYDLIQRSPGGTEPYTAADKRAFVAAVLARSGISLHR